MTETTDHLAEFNRIAKESLATNVEEYNLIDGKWVMVVPRPKPKAKATPAPPPVKKSMGGMRLFGVELETRNAQIIASPLPAREAALFFDVTLRTISTVRAEARKQAKATRVAAKEAAKQAKADVLARERARLEAFKSEVGSFVGNATETAVHFGIERKRVYQIWRGLKITPA